MCNNINDLLEIASTYDVISFDIFDTLIMRTVPDPLMVFDMVGNIARDNGIIIDDFRKVRWDAQLERGIPNENLNEVYEQLQIMTGISDSQRDLLFNAEIECEKKVLIRREDICTCFANLKKMGKKVYIVSDMYLTKAILVDILDNLSISGYEDMLVSCEYRRLKMEGLYEELIKRFDENSKFLHIGDNAFGDGECAEKYGIDTMIIPSGISLFKKCLNEECDFSKINYSDVMQYLGEQIAKLYNSPFVHNMNYLNPNYVWGYVCIAPYFLNAVQWIIETAEDEGCNGILFSARDGYIPYKIFCELQKKVKLDVEGWYFYVSRKVAVACNSDKNEILNFLVDSSIAMIGGEDILKEKFCLPQSEIKHYDVNEYGEDIYRYIWDHYDAIRKNVVRLKSNYYRYMGNLGLQIGKKYALYDFVSSGTCQRNLDIFTPFEVIGAYIHKIGKDNEIKVKSFIISPDSWMIKNYKLMERVMSSQEPSLKDINEIGNPIFLDESRTNRELSIIRLIQSGIMDYVKAYLGHNGLTEKHDVNYYENILTMSDFFKLSEIQSYQLFDDWNNM